MEHDPGKCNLPVQNCAPCSAAENDPGPVYDWQTNPEAYEDDEPEPR